MGSFLGKVYKNQSTCKDIETVTNVFLNEKYHLVMNACVLNYSGFTVSSPEVLTKST